MLSRDNCLNLFEVVSIEKKEEENVFWIRFEMKGGSEKDWHFDNKEQQDANYEELQKFLNNNYKLRDFSN